MNVKDCRGDVMESTRFKQVCTAEEFAELVEQKARERGVPVKVRVDTIRSGGMMFGTTCPCVLVSHPNPPQRYFDQIVIFNGNVVSFKYWGESKANTNHNKKQEYRGSLKSLFVNDDQMALQTEMAWHSELREIYESLMS